MRHFIVATAGHVDHGKSSLVQALTGTDPDRLPEEKARQITIELGFAELKVDTDTSLALIDVPGHEDFVRNMIAGVGCIDVALLVIAADDGWMPQTEEHLHILEYLGIKKAVVCLTKSELSDAAATETEIRRQLEGTALAESPIVRCSIRANTGLEHVRLALARAVKEISPQPDIGKPRLALDRAFSMRGIGTVVTGTLTGGSLAPGDLIVLQPRNVPARIRSLQSHGRGVDRALPGTRTALSLPELTAGRDIERGDTVAIDGFKATAVCEALVRRSPRNRRSRHLKSGGYVYFHHATTRTSARLNLLGQKTLGPGEETLAQFHLASPVLAFVGDRFVLRDGSEQNTVAGGLILSVAAWPARRPPLEHRRWLERRLAQLNDVDRMVLSELERCGHTAPSEVLRESHFSSAVVAQALQRLSNSGKIFLRGDLAVDLTKWKTACSRANQTINRHHDATPERAGVEISDVRAELHDLAPPLVDLILEELARHDFVRDGSTIARRSHRPALTAQLDSVAADVRTVLARQPFDPPSRKHIETDKSHATALRFLIEKGEVIPVSSELVLLAGTVTEMKKLIERFISNHGAATVSQLRQELGTSRRVLVPLLEFFDRQAVTRRLGDKRVLAKDSVTGTNVTVT